MAEQADNLVAKLLEPVEGIFGSIGLRTPMSRFFTFTAIGTGIEFYFKPSYAFLPDGTMKKVALISSEPGATYTPPGLFPSIAGLIMSLYV